ncbi:MAG TPA: phosphoglycerate kinase [Rhabdochlamydiaceae bacterium]|nr:phosphoglycerate kinase [Rhabdochlamydiaceae bacterium]
MTKLSLTDIPLKGKKVLMRVDFNVPQNKDGTIADDSRIKETLPSIKYVLDQGGALILMSHLGRPKGKKDPKYTLAPCAKCLSKWIGVPVAFASDCIGPEVEKAARELKSGQVLLLENVRFYEAEENPSADPSFAQKLAKLGDVYVNDAFGTAHREHSSTAIIAKYFPEKAAAGFLLQKEISFLSSILADPKRPFYTIIGGSKISTKMGVLNSLTSKVDGLFIGGGMAFTFFKAQGISIGNSIHEDDLLEDAKEFLKNCESKKVKIWLPKDLIIAKGSEIKCVSIEEGIPDQWQGMDIGPATIAEWKSALSKAATIFWNGPVGVFENPKFATGTNEIATTLSTLKATTIVGGGDSVSAINALGIAQKFTHVSTGGGASLEFIEFGRLPGIDALSDKT